MLYSLPPSLIQALDRYMRTCDRAKLSKAVARVHDKYSAFSLDRSLCGEEEALAYILFRMPATFAAIQYVLSRVQEIEPAFAPTSLLDIGCGPGTVFFAMKEVYTSLERVKSIDRNSSFLDLFSKLLSSLKLSPPKMVCQEAALLHEEEQWDVGMCSYMLGELRENDREEVLSKVAQACSYLLILEPGTPEGYKTILQLRSWAASHGYTIVAPCPHALLCPMRECTSWCHVRVRLQRPSFLQSLKEGTKGYEDEALSYLILKRSKEMASPYARVVDTPQKRKGHVNLHLCEPNGKLEKVVVSKKDKDLYSQAKELEWGDLWPHIIQSKL